MERGLLAASRVIKPPEVFLLPERKKADAGRAGQAARCDWAPGGPPPHPDASGRGWASRLLRSRLRAPIDPVAAAPPLYPLASGGRLGAPRGAREPALPFAAAAAISVFTGREGRGLAAAAGAGFSPGTVLSLAFLFLLRASSPAPCALPAQPGSGREEEGTARGGRGWKVDARSEATPARSVRPRAQCACRPCLGGCGCGGGSRKGLS